MVALLIRLGLGWTFHSAAFRFVAFHFATFQFVFFALWFCFANCIDHACCYNIPLYGSIFQIFMAVVTCGLIWRVTVPLVDT